MTRQLRHAVRALHDHLIAELDARPHSFDDTAKAMLMEIRKATGAEKLRLGGAFGGFLRRQRSRARLVLAEDLMRGLRITATQHVAFEVMQRVFDEGSSTELLDHWFAVPGRDAREKHAAAAREALGASPDVVDSYAELYQWFCGEIKRRVAQIKLQIKEA